MPTFCFAFECQFSQEKCFWAKKSLSILIFSTKKNCSSFRAYIANSIDYFEKNKEKIENLLESKNRQKRKL